MPGLPARGQLAETRPTSACSRSASSGWAARSATRTRIRSARSCAAGRCGGPGPRHLPVASTARRVCDCGHGHLRHHAVRQADVVTVGMGLAASMGQFLLTAGAPGKRYITPHTRVLFAPASAVPGGSATEICINADLISDEEGTRLISRGSYGQAPLEQVGKPTGDRDHWSSAAGGARLRVRRCDQQPREIGTRGENR